MTGSGPSTWVGVAATVTCFLGVGSLGLQAEWVDDPPESRSGILVELFTSQGCSSCPPADRYLTELAAREDLDVIPLSFHVDYWNYIGWTDPFSSAAWSDRQRRYARKFGGNRIYTPQMVVSGRWEAVGSHRNDISRLLDRAGAEPRRAQLLLSAELESENLLRVNVRMKLSDPKAAPDDLAVWVAVVESALETPVARGENASKKLRNDRVVRRLEQLGDPTGGGSTGSATLRIELDETWSRDRLSVTAFMQDSTSLNIYSASELPLKK